jgi:hypothetical protein
LARISAGSAAALKNRGFSASVALTLGLGTGATVSVFSIIYAVMIRSLPYSDPARLVSVFQSKTANDGTDLDGFSPATFLAFRQQSHAFTDSTSRLIATSITI